MCRFCVFVCVAYCVSLPPTSYPTPCSAVAAILGHSSGALALAFFITETLCYRSIWTIWLFCSLIPSLYEVLLLFAVYVRKVSY